MYDKNLYDINTENELFNSVRISKPAGNYVCDTCGGEIVKGTGYV